MLIRYTENIKLFAYLHKRHRQETKYWSLVIVARSIMYTASSSLGHLVFQPREALGAYEAVIHMMVSLIAAGAHWFKRPYKDQTANTLEQLTLAVMFVLSAIAMLFTMERTTVLADFLEILAPPVVLYLIIKGFRNLVNEMAFRNELLRLKSGARSFINFNDAIDQRLTIVGPGGTNVALALTVSGGIKDVGPLALQTEQVLALVVTESHDTAGTEHHMTTRSILAVSDTGEVNVKQLFAGPMGKKRSFVVDGAQRDWTARKAAQYSKDLLLSVWGVDSPGDSVVDALVHERAVEGENVYWAGPISEATLFARQCYNVAFLADGLQDVDIVGLHHTLASHSFTRMHLDAVMRSMMRIFLLQQRRSIEKSGKDRRGYIARIGSWVVKKVEYVLMSGLVAMLLPKHMVKGARDKIRRLLRCNRDARTMLQQYFDKLEDAINAHWSARSVGLGVVDRSYDERTNVFGGEVQGLEPKLERMGFYADGGESHDAILSAFEAFKEWYLNVSGEAVARSVQQRQAELARRKAFQKEIDELQLDGAARTRSDSAASTASLNSPRGSPKEMEAHLTIPEAEFHEKLNNVFSRLLYLMTRGDFSFVTVPFLLKWMRHPEVTVELRQRYKDGMRLVDDYCRSHLGWRVVFDLDPAGYSPGGYAGATKFSCGIVILDEFEKNIPGTERPRDEYFLHGRFSPQKVGLWARAEPYDDDVFPPKHPVWVGVTVSDLPSATEKYELSLWMADTRRGMPAAAQPRLVNAHHFHLRFSVYDRPCEVWAPSSYGQVPDKMPDHLPMAYNAKASPPRLSIPSAILLSKKRTRADVVKGMSKK
uniref:Uncharacterized protein n=1 Tax=Bicosoecida sp. CB-2014 TaxID=1486930 RepID=A0A7S1CFD8_9STRA